VAPATKDLSSVDCAKAKPFLITAEQINGFLNGVRSSNSIIVMSYGRTIFRPYARLPDGFGRQMSKFQVTNENNSCSYYFDVSQGQGLKIVVDPKNLIVLSCTPVGDKDAVNAVERPVSISDDEALGLVINYQNYHTNIYYRGSGNYDAGRSLFGKRTHLFWLFMKGLSPATPSCVLLLEGASGKLMEKDLQSLTEVCLAEFPQVDDPNVHKLIMRTFLHLYDPKQVIIATVEDIPLYQKQRLKPGAETEVCPMLAESIPPASFAYTICTYTQVGGIVRRYRFLFKEKKTLQVPKYIEIGRDIGDAMHRV
jgi:hypothetical protein